MDDGWELDGGAEIGGGEDADGVAVEAGQDGALDGDGLFELDLVALDAHGQGGDAVCDLAEGVVICGGQVAGDEVAEWVGVDALLEEDGLGDEGPFVEFADVDGAIPAMCAYWSSCEDFGLEGHGEAFECLRLLDV